MGKKLVFLLMGFSLFIIGCSTPSTPSAPQYLSKDLGMPYRQQLLDYYCGPASIHMTALLYDSYFDVDYWYYSDSVGDATAQDYIARICQTAPKLGTYVYQISDFLKNHYIGWGAIDSDLWGWYRTNYANDVSARVQNSVDNQSPVIARVNTSYLNTGWNFATRHYIPAYGYENFSTTTYNNSTSWVIFNDPWWGSGGGAGKKTTVSDFTDAVAYTGGSSGAYTYDTIGGYIVYNDTTTASRSAASARSLYAGTKAKAVATVKKLGAKLVYDPTKTLNKSAASSNEGRDNIAVPFGYKGKGKAPTKNSSSSGKKNG